MKAILIGSLSYFLGIGNAISSEMHRHLSDEGVHVEHRMLAAGQAELFQMQSMTNFQPKFSAAPVSKKCTNFFLHIFLI